MKVSSLLKDRRYWPFFWTQFLGALTDNALKNGLVVLITFKSLVLFGITSAHMVAFCGGIFILPFFLFSPIAGQIADKYEKSRIIRILKLTEILLMFMASFGFLSGRYELLVVVLFLMGVQSAFFGPIKYSILPQLILIRELVAGTALVEFGTFSAILLGTIAGGLLVTLKSGIWISIGLITFATLGWVNSRFINSAEPKDKNLKISLEPFSTIAESFRHMKKELSVFYSVFAISWFWFFGASLLSLLPTYTRDVLSGNEYLITFFLALFTIGIGTGSIICEKLSSDRLETGLVPLGAIGMTLFAFDIFLAGVPYDPSAPIGIARFIGMPGGIRIFIDFLLLSISGGLFIVPLYTLIQQRSDTSDRARIIAGNNILNALFMVVAAALVMEFFSIGLTIPQMFGILAGLNTVASLLVFAAVPEFPKRFLARVRLYMP